MERPNHADPTLEETPAAERRDPRVEHLERRLLEAFDDLWNDFVDPTDAYYDVDGLRWNPLGTAAAGGGPAGAPFASEEQLAEIRAYCRTLAANNEFAINGHENRVSYVVGSGHADKTQVQMMVRVLLPTSGAKSADAADALAVAICHAQHRGARVRASA